ncbi:hypothetical protein [Nocardioides massiliensis]|uniref:Uncharacterized protein n=1 Tax=Nocardioides massiliensis TaxID=1325935 RepID=A0ABT9NJ63_9ACTN|nr:hypothetical protein [Nocardioides massiliensis]MDP9820462.1 hypothetical protein [Nocardioides massiliensis]
MTETPSMAEVLAEHDDPPGWMWSASDQMVYACECGDHYAAGPIDVIQEVEVTAAAEWHRAHVAQALAAAGFGHVASVEAERDAFFGKAMEFKRIAIENAERAQAAEAQVAAARALADEWMANSNEVSKFIDADHAADLRHALDGEDN